MANTNLFIMSKGSKPGDTPSVTSNPNAYYDTPTNPLVICDDTLTADTTVACYEIRNDNSLPKNGKPVATGVLVNNGSGYSTSVSTIVVDTIDPRIKFKIGHHVYKSNGTLLGTVSSMTNVGITFTANILASLANNDELYTAQGVSNSDEYNILNRIYPNTAATSELYLENLENTPGYRILCATYQADGTTINLGQNISSINITTDDYFVMINADDPLKHHFAKITHIDTSDVAGDSFEFSPKYGSEISKGTKFTIYKGPPVTDTAVVAVSYGLYGNAVNYGTDSDETDGTGTATDSRHSGMTYISKPIFYFYNDRLNKKNELDHNTKYMLHYSRSDDGTETHYKRCFLTCQDYGLKAVDYGPYTMNATMVDKSRDYDDFHSSLALSIAIADTSVTNSYNFDAEDWDKCFINNKRHNGNLLFGQTWEGSGSGNVPEGSFVGPTRYLHYDTSPELNNIVPEVIELDVFDSINESGGYVDARIVDSKRIYGSKINEYDTIKVKKLIDTGSLSNDYVGLLPGKFTTVAGGSHIEVELTNSAQDIRVLLGTSTTFEDIKVGDYVYSIASISTVVNGSQQIEVLEGRLFSSPYFDGTITTTQETLSEVNGYRKPWSNHMNNLIVDFTIDTTVNYSDPHTMSSIVYGNNTSTTGSASGSRLYNAEIVLTSGQQTGLSFKIDYGDSNHNIITLQSPRLQLYRLETANDPNFLSYYNGRYSVYKTIFVGEVESLENYVEDGMLKYHLSGRNKINKLLGPIVNKNYRHTDDIIYSTIGPFEHITNLSFSSYMATNTVNMVGNTGITTLSTITGVSIGDLLFTQEGYFIGRIKDLTGGITLEEGSLVNLYDRVNTDALQTLYVIRPNRNSISLAKAMSKNTVTSNSVSSLTGTANKGLIFTNGNKLTDDAYGRPNVEGNTLAGTSSSTNPNALGYYLNHPKSVSKDSAFFVELKDELTPANIERHTVNSLTEYEVVSVTSGEGETIIEIAPNCPIIMGRMDENAADVNIEDLTISNFSVRGITDSSTSSIPEGHYSGICMQGGTPSAGASEAYTAFNGKHLYLSDGTYLGKITGTEQIASSTFWMAFDRKLPKTIATGTYIYTSTNKNHGLYLINSQGLRSGGVLQLVNSELSTEGRPIIYNASLDTNSNGNLNFNDLSYRHGGFTYRYLNLQKTNKGGLHYSKNLLDTGTPSKVYSREKGEFNSYATAYKIIPGIKTVPITNNYGTNNDYTNSYEKQDSIDSRGIFSAAGGNFADHTIYPTGNLNTKYDLLPKVRSRLFGGNWNTAKDDGSNAGAFFGSTFDEIKGVHANSVSRVKDGWEIIDPKTITTFLYSPSDFWPDSMSREHHIGNISRNFSDYNIMLRAKPSLIASNMEHQKYKGSANYIEEKDASYQTLNISAATINTNEMKRLGLMRLIECTYDWHFNLVDPENPPTTKDVVGQFTYDRYQKVIASGMYVQTGGYATSDTVITTKTASSGGGAADPSVKFANGYVYDNKGNAIGFVSSVNSTTITLTASAYKPNGTLYIGELYYLNQAAIGTNSKPHYHYMVSGRGGKSTFCKVNVNSIGRKTSGEDYYDTDAATDSLPLHMLQSGVFNTKGDDADDGYGQGTGNEFDNYFVGKMDMAFSDNHDVGKGNVLVLPPVFKGFELISLGYRYASGGGAYTAVTAGECKTNAVAGQNNIHYSNNTPLDVIDQGLGGPSGGSGTALTTGSHLFTENGEFIGEISTLEVAWPNSDDTSFVISGGLKCDVEAGTALYIGLIPNSGGGFIGATGVESSYNNGGFHPLATKELVSHNNSPTNEFEHPSRVLSALKHDVPIRGKATNVQEYFVPTTVTGTTYAAVSGSPDTITSSANNFISAGFKNGMIIKVTGSSESANNTSHIVSKVEAGTLTLSTNTSLTDDSAGDSWTITAVTGPSLKNSIYNNMRAVILRRFSIEMTGSEKVDIGASTLCATNYTEPTIFRKMGNVYESSDTVYKPSFYAIHTPHEVFARYKISETSSALEMNAGNDSGTGTNVADGADFVLKPLLETDNASVTKNYGYISPNGETDLTQLIIDTSSAETGTGTIRTSSNKWLEFVPNLTGCYLVSNDGIRIEDLNVKTGSNDWVTSIDDRMPNKIHYIVSHTIRTDSYPTEQGGIFNKHVLLIDNCTNSGELGTNYRIMRPAHVCLWPESPTEIDLYKSTSKYTKMPNSPDMYDDIGDFSFYEDGWLKGEKSSANYNEGVQSMYVVVNPDHTSTSNRFLVPRTVSGNHASNLFGDGNTFNNGSYDMLLNDGVNKYRRTVKINTESKSTYNYTSIDYSEKLDSKMSGVVSLGEIFTLTSNQEVTLNNVETASIGTTVSVGMEAEEIINDILENNDIEYTNSTISYPYFTTPNIQGADIYNSTKFLAGFKNKELLIDKDEIKLIVNNDTTRYTDIEINENNDNIKVVEIEQNKSGFDIYNEITIYGNGVKSTKQNVRSIKNIGKKTLEEFDDNLSTQTEVDSKARNLLDFYNRNEKRVTVKLSNKNLEWIKSGDIIVIDYPSEHIPRGDYIILEVKHETSGLLTIQAGGYSKALDSRLAEIIVNNKKMASFLRSDRFKSSPINYSDFDSIKLKPIRIIGTKTSVSGHTPLGLTTLLGFDTLLRIGTRTTSEVLREDLI